MPKYKRYLKCFLIGMFSPILVLLLTACTANNEKSAEHVLTADIGLKIQNTQTRSGNNVVVTVYQVSTADGLRLEGDAELKAFLNGNSYVLRENAYHNPYPLGYTNTRYYYVADLPAAKAGDKLRIALIRGNQVDATMSSVSLLPPVVINKPADNATVNDKQGFTLSWNPVDMDDTLNIMGNGALSKLHYKADDSIGFYDVMPWSKPFEFDSGQLIITRSQTGDLDPVLGGGSISTSTNSELDLNVVG